MDVDLLDRFVSKIPDHISSTEILTSTTVLQRIKGERIPVILIALDWL